MSRFKEKYGLLLIGILLGVAYGVISRLIFGQKSALASVSYLFIVPIILGILPLLFADNDKLKSYRKIIFIPWLTVFIFFFIIVLFKIEDLLCLIILAAPFLVLTTIGAFIYRILEISKYNREKTLPIIVLLPFIFGSVEEVFKSPSDVFHVKSDVIIDAAPQNIWDHIVEVQAIDQKEFNAGFLNSLGIPRPISATVSKKEIGGQRVGRFDGGLEFKETITDYQENKKISFDIKIEPKTIRQRVFDQHVLSGNYFKFVDATYELTTVSERQVKLTLSSRYQLTSKINFYGKFWGDIILSDFQCRLLSVIKKRCEISND